MTAFAIVRIDVHNADEYAKYVELAGPAVAKYGGQFLARGGKTIVKEGTTRSRNVVIQFPDLETGERFYEGPEYQEALVFALAKGVSTRDYVLVEGL